MATPIIEITGPPGVGKSTIYQALCRTWKPNAGWIYPDALLSPQPGFFSFGKWLTYHLRLLLGKKLTKSVPVDYSLRFAGQHRELANFCWAMLSDTHIYPDNEISKRFRSACFLFTSFGIYQAIQEKAPAKPCIVEEGFLQKSFFIHDDEKNEQLVNKLLNEYLLLIPLPRVIIYIDTPDTTEIVKRLRGRNKTIASHHGKDDAALHRDIEKWQQTQHSILEKLQQAGVLIFRLNGKMPVKENVSAIIELLSKTGDVRKTGAVNSWQDTSLPVASVLKATRR